MSDKDPFIGYLSSLRHEDTGTLAALRRACGQRLAESRNCQWFSSVSTNPHDFLTATLAAQYPSDKIKKGQHTCEYQHKGSIGAAWAEYCRKRKKEEDPAIFYAKRQADLAGGRSPANIPSIHERFRTLLDTELEWNGTGELAYRLRGLVRMLVAAEIPIDVIQLAHDLRGWRAESRYVQERWAKAFYSPPSRGKSATATSDEQGETEELETQDQEEDEDAD
ncbi:MAG: type I-E CRISPR-associated protein Cse2/CasB [Thermodesulfobacteriota bacterium]